MPEIVKYLKVKNWDEFQHYKDRNPPWIKLHRDLLRDYKFTCLQDDSKLHLMLIWLLASQLDNKIPCDINFIKNQIGIRGSVDFKPLIENGFLIDESDTLAQRKQVAMLETETETETYIMQNGFDVFWSIYPKKRAGSKTNAKKSYNKALKRDTEENIIQGVKEYAKSEEVKKGFAKGATAWLNDDRWMNEYRATVASEKHFSGFGGG